MAKDCRDYDPFVAKAISRLWFCRFITIKTGCLKRLTNWSFVKEQTRTNDFRPRKACNKIDGICTLKKPILNITKECRSKSKWRIDKFNNRRWLIRNDESPEIHIVWLPIFPLVITDVFLWRFACPQGWHSFCYFGISEKIRKACAKTVTSKMWLRRLW